MNKGWIKLHRKLLNSDMYRSLNSKQRDVMLICLLLANHKGKEWVWKGKLYKCESGQFITSLEELVKLTARDVTSQNVRTCLLKLETWRFLTNKSTNKNRLITICNWSTYQDDEKETNKQLTSNQQTTNKQLTNKLTTNKNVKNIKNEKNEKNEDYSSQNNSKKTFEKDSVEYLFALKFYQDIKVFDKNYKEPNLQTWAKDIDRMFRLESYPKEEIKIAYEFMRKDGFWRPNILCPATFRKQLPKLVNKAKVINGIFKEQQIDEFFDQRESNESHDPEDIF